MKKPHAPPPAQLVSFFFVLIVLFSMVEIGGAQTTRTINATLDPSEERAVNSIFQRWGINGTNQGWNISGVLCSGVAIDESVTIARINPGIKCNCSFDSGTTCRITALRVYMLDVDGRIPNELWTLTFLTDLNLAENYLTGPLPASIGNLTRMQSFNVGHNALSGEIPRELGRLTDLTFLSCGTNNFFGPLPYELGSLTRLTQIYIDSAGVSGPIPQSFSNLTRLERVYASAIELSGQIPDFIGNWSNLVALRFQGNSFQGPIPPSFSRLTSLNELRISDLSNGSSSLDFLQNMAYLTTLVLRNNNISGFVPSNLGRYQTLTLLDLSFNNLTGRIPDSLFNLRSLSTLFLGNNKLTGTLPQIKSPFLRNIDLSYNGLSGSFPSWVSEQNLQLNLVANNFTIDNSNGSVLPSGLHCLQQNFPCGRGSPIYSRFAIKCGGRQIRSSDQIVYDMDNETLGPATYYMTRTNRWAVSNVGLPSSDSNAPQYTSFSLSPVTNTLDSELFQTARISAGSLRYYGLGLENGNYTVRLLFAENQIIDTMSRRSVGRRVFDVYVQGKLKLKDFDIRREAGGTALRAVVREFTAQVAENYLEIHLFWAGKGTCCAPHPGVYGPSISAISATPDFVPTVGNTPPGGKKNRTGLIVGTVVAVGAVSFLSILAAYYLVQRRRNKLDGDEELLALDARPYMFSYADLRAATDDFSPANKLGEGGFGPVYKGTLQDKDKRVVAVKQLSAASRQGKSQFVAEIAAISAVQHRNLVKLYGCCIEGEKRLLVYEYLENKSLDKILFENRSLCLDWPTRFDICLGVARGLAYLHEESQPRIVHRDVKASNILLDSNLNPKISDFGLAKLYKDKETHISTHVAGTYGYLAPEYAMRGHLTEKADVFSFGVVALEIVSGRLNSDPSLEDDDKMYLLGWAWNLHEKNQEMELVDRTLSEVNEDEVKRIIGVALLCSQTSPSSRPSMSRVVFMLSGDIEVPPATTKPGYLTELQFRDPTTFMSYSDSVTSRGDLITPGSSSNITSRATTDPSYSPVHDSSKPFLHEIIGDSR